MTYEETSSMPRIEISNLDNLTGIEGWNAIRNE
jgi:hypothetical protein